MPDVSERLVDAQEAAGDGELPYISKSRVMQWIKNPEHFRLKYLEGLRPDETEAMRRGTRLHETFEDYYHGLYAYAEGTDELPHFHQLDSFLLGYKKWADFVEPYVSNFLLFENRRLEASDTLDDFLPVGVEEEIWVNPEDPSQPEWMGISDALYTAASIPEVDADEGVVVVDFKTGSVPAERYRDDGIHVELEYYRTLFEERYNVVASAVYYPRTDAFIVSPQDEAKRAVFAAKINEAVEEMVHHTENYEKYDHFETKPGPLCKWGESSDEQSDYYGICPCSWGVPVNNKDTFAELVNEGHEPYVIADMMGTSTDAVRYWKSKLDL